MLYWRILLFSMGVTLCSEEAWGLFWVKQQPLEAHGLCISAFDV